MVAMLSGCGLRRAELLGLSLESIQGRTGGRIEENAGDRRAVRVRLHWEDAAVETAHAPICSRTLAADR
jgi:integrase